MSGKRILSKRGGERRKEPLEVRLTMRFRFGDEEGEAVTVLKDRRLPMVNSVFHYRDRIMRNFTMLMVKAGMKQPKVLRELMPWIPGLKRKRRRTT